MASMYKSMVRDSPVFIHVDHDYVYVSELGNHCVSVFTTSGRFVHTIGRLGRGPGELRDPLGVVVAQMGLFMFVIYSTIVYKYFNY